MNRSDAPRVVVTASEILETSLYADDLDAAAAFYKRVLGLRVQSRVEERHVFFRVGGRMLLVFNAMKTLDAGGSTPSHGTRGPGHIAFAVREHDLDRWRAHLSEQGVAVEHEITWPSGGRSIYFRDPAGNSVEVATPRTWEIPEPEVFGS